MRTLLATAIVVLLIAPAMPALAVTAAELQAEIAALTAQLNALIGANAPAGACAFSRDLTIGSTGEDIKCLQQYLNAAGFQIAASGAGSPGNESTYFGPRTRVALGKWQAANGITPSTGYFGAKSRAKYASIAVAPPLPPAPPMLPEPAPAPPPPPAPTPPPPASGPLPTPGQLGMPAITFFGWGKDYQKIQFTHDPGTFTRSYKFSIKRPGQTTATVYGPYAFPTAIGEVKALENSHTFARIGPTSWEFRRSLDFATVPDGTYEANVSAVGDGATEGTASSGWSTVLYARAEFESLLEGAPLRAVVNNVITAFPITVRLANPLSQLYYRYAVLDGTTVIWESGYLRQSASPKIEASFSNVNGYPFVAGKNYRIQVNIYDTNSGQDSANTQKPNEITFTVQ